MRALLPADRDWLDRFIAQHWGSPQVVSRGIVHDARNLPGYVADQDGRPVGAVTYNLRDDQCEVVSLNSLVEGMGIGTALLDAVKEVAQSAGCRRLWLVTTNDNLPALRFYQKRGFKLVAVHRNAVETSRQLKPSIPLIGLDGIPIRDEIELELNL